MNTPVNSTIAQVLKEKGFDEKVFRYFDIHYETPNDFYSLGSFENWNVQPSLISAPTIAEAVMWLHKEKGLWVNVMYMGFELKYTWSIDIITTSGSDWDSYGEEGDICYKSPTEAYEAAIEYTLKNLI